MIRRAVVLCLVGGLFSVFSGCGFLCRGYVCPSYSAPACGSGACDEGDCGVPYAATRACRAGAACGGCGNGCGYDGRPVGPLTWLFDLFECRSYRDCGCGERYWGDWWSNPPGCEPCDRCGNYIGGGEVGYGGARAGMSYEGAQSTGYSPSAKARAGDCPTCNQPEYASRKQPVRTGQASASQQYAPRVISTTDRAVKPARAVAVDEEGVPHLAQPRAVPAQR